MAYIKKLDNFVNEGRMTESRVNEALRRGNNDDYRFYVVSQNEADKLAGEYGSVEAIPNDVFIREAEAEGTVYSIDGFADAYNNMDLPTVGYSVLRILPKIVYSKVSESRSSRGGKMLNEGYSVNFLRKLVHRIVNSKTNNEYFNFYGKKIELQSGTENYVDVCIDDNIHFSIDYDTNEVNFESIGEEDEKFVEDISDALHKELDGRFGKVQISFNDNISYEDDTPSQWYYLSNDDKRVLRTMTSNPEDIKEIAELTDNEKIEFRDNKGILISADDAFERLGQEQFLSGLLRATYHWSCARGEGQNEVTFRLKRKGE